MESKKNIKVVLESDRAVSEIVGSILMMGIVIMAVSVILLTNLPNIQKLKEDAVAKNVEQAFSIIDMRTSDVVLGDTTLRSTTGIDIGGGSLAVEPNIPGKDSYIMFRAENGAFNFTVPMGKLKYHLGDRVVALEGGGVFSGSSAGTEILSSPDYSYNDATLTLSGSSVRGNYSNGGNGVVTVGVKKGLSNVKYPINKRNMSNPIDYNATERVYMYVVSDYYDVWGRYLEDVMQEDNIIVDSMNRTVVAEFNVVPDYMGKRTPLKDPIKMKGFPKKKKDPLNNFTLRIYDDKKFSNFDWDFRAKIGNKELIFHIFKRDLRIGYREDGKLADGETWGTVNYPMKTDSFGDYIDIDLLDKNVTTTYSNQQVGSDNAVGCQPFATKINGISKPDYSWDNLVIDTNNVNKTQSLYNITQHYISEMAENAQRDVILWQCSPADKKPEAPSSMILGYDTTGELTFLYATDHIADVDIN